MLRRLARFTISAPPPSVNAMYTPVGHGRNIMSREGRAWVEMAQLELLTQPGLGDQPGYWRSDVLIPGGSTRNSADLPNFEKALHDVLVKAQKVPDDRYIVDYRLRYHDGETVSIVVKREETAKWTKIRNASKSLIRKLAKFSV